MTRPRTIPARAAAALVASALLALLALTGCSPDAAPSPTPTPLFASEDEAFAAAEATYRAYNDALNAVDFADPATFEPVYEFLSDTAASSTKKAFSEFHAEHLRSIGATAFDSFTPVSADLGHGEVRANLCIDVSGVDVVDASGNSVVSADRPPRQPLTVTFRAHHGQPSITIIGLEVSEDFECAH